MREYGECCEEPGDVGAAVRHRHRVQECPEWFGQVVGLLVRAQACSNDHLMDLVQDIGINVEELCSDQGATIEYYNRFMDTVSDVSRHKKACDASACPPCAAGTARSAIIHELKGKQT